MKLETVLKNLGFSDKEAKIYLTLLSMGESNLREIADRAEIPRTTLYTPVQILIKKGFVEFYKRVGRKYYVAINPQKLLELIQGNSALLEEHIEELQQLKHEGVKPKIRFFEGREGIKLILNEILQEKRNFLAITCIEDMQKMAWEYFEDFIEKRVKQNLRVRLLTNRSRESQILKENDAKELRETRFVPQEYRFDTANYIFGDNVAILSLKQEPVVALLIEDKAIAETQRMYFDLIWKMTTSS